MWPVIMSWGPIAIKSFGVMLFLGLFFGGFIFWQKGREEGVEEEKLMDVWLMTGLASLLFARVGFILDHWVEMSKS